MTAGPEVLASLSAAPRPRGDVRAADATGLVGRPVPRREDARVLRGETRYLDDIELPDLAHVAFVRSPHAHARVNAVRAPDDAPGLLAVVSAADLAGRVRPLPVQPVEGATLADEPHPVLASDEVRYVGQPVAAVVAESRALAEDAAELLEVDYEPLKAIVEPEASDAELMRWHRRTGDVEGAFADAAHVVRTRHAIPRLAAVPMEPRGALASHDAGRDVLTLWCSAQETHRPLAQLAHVLGRPEDAIHVIVPDVGGAFGSKGALAPEAAVVAVAAMDLGRPCKWAEDRWENFVAAYQGRGVRAEVELALDGDGRMLALRARLIADLGAYLLPSTAIPPHTMAMLMTGCYDMAAAEVELVGARTHKVPTGPYRGAGRPEAAFLLERTVDAAARELGADPVELRRRNLIRSFPHRSLLGYSYDSGDYERLLDEAVALIRPEPRGGEGRLVGTGVALYVERAAGQWESADLTIEPSGRVIVRSSASPHGQGHDTTFAQIAAERLGVELGDVALRLGDSAVVRRGVGTFGSRSTAVAGSAIALAADRVLERCRAVAAVLLDAPEDVVTHAGGRFSADGREVAFREVAAAAYQPRRLPAGMEPGLTASARFSSDLVFSSGAYAATVEVERATGVLRVLRLAAVDDAGRIVNPLLAEGQVIGGTVQGLGAVLTEEVVHDEGGQPVSSSLLDYGLLTAAELPPLATAFVESPSPRNPLGAKGVGEAGTIGTPAAVANAVTAALGGRHVDPPFTAERLWNALQEDLR
jgi:carbon-monoxide dehydrogenase large subunit